jgi:hypothetical protein
MQVLDEYTDKLYDQFVGEGGKQQRAALKEEREKIKKDAETAVLARIQARRERAQVRGPIRFIILTNPICRRGGSAAWRW